MKGQPPLMAPCQLSSAELFGAPLGQAFVAQASTCVWGWCRTHKVYSGLEKDGYSSLGPRHSRDLTLCSEPGTRKKCNSIIRTSIPPYKPRKEPNITHTHTHAHTHTQTKYIYIYTRNLSETHKLLRKQRFCLFFLPLLPTPKPDPPLRKALDPHKTTKTHQTLNLHISKRISR